jgi:hypothetical protein
MTINVEAYVLLFPSAWRMAEHVATNINSISINPWSYYYY